MQEDSTSGVPLTMLSQILTAVSGVQQSAKNMEENHEKHLDDDRRSFQLIHDNMNSFREDMKGISKLITQFAVMNEKMEGIKTSMDEKMGGIKTSLADLKEVADGNSVDISKINTWRTSMNTRLAIYSSIGASIGAIASALLVWWLTK